MTKKHFIALADVLRTIKPTDKSFQRMQWNIDVNALADFCYSQNPNFNRSRWMGYIAGECGPNGGKVGR